MNQSHGNTWWTGALSSTVLSTASAVLADEVPRPNILIITSDDQSINVGCYGDPYAVTPHLDQLAADGMRFTRGYSPHASCSPARSSLLTGLFSHQNGHIGLAHAHPLYRLKDGTPTLPAVLGDAGYRTGIIGKLHLAPANAFPFDYNAPLTTMETLDVGRVAEYAEAFLAEQGEEPFFLYVNYFDPHRPFSNTVAGIPETPYTGADVEPLPFLRVDSPALREDVAGYYNGIRRMDTGVGWLLDVLSQAGFATNTVVIFVGDQGADYPRAKTSSYEAGEHVPFIVRWPGVVAPGSVSDALVSFVDVMPTVLEAAGLDADTFTFAGRPLHPLLEALGPVAWRETLMGSYTSHAESHLYPRRSLRDARWKLIHNLDHIRPNPVQMLGLARADTAIDEEARQAYLRFYHPPEFELYDLHDDPYELRNLADDPVYADELQRMQAALHAWRVETDDPLLEQAEIDRLKRAHGLDVPLPPDTGFIETAASFPLALYEGERPMFCIGWARDDHAPLWTRTDTAVSVALHTAGELRGQLQWRLIWDDVPVNGHDTFVSAVNTNWSAGDTVRLHLAYNPSTGVTTARAANETTGELIAYGSVTNAGIIGLDHTDVAVYNDWQETAADAFDRSNTVFANQAAVPSVIGSAWLSGGSNPDATFRIFNGMLDFGTGFSGPAPGILLHTGTETRNDQGYRFRFSATGMPDNNSNVLAGVVWQYQDAGNFYYARYIPTSKSLQFLRWVNGVEQYLAGASGSEIMPDWVNGKQYEWTITSEQPYHFHMEVKDLDTGDVLSLTASDPLGSHAGGYAGLICGAGAVFFDDVHVQVNAVLPLEVPDEADQKPFVRWGTPPTAELERSVTSNGMALLTHKGNAVAPEGFGTLLQAPEAFASVHKAGLAGLKLLFARGVVSLDHDGAGSLQPALNAFDEGMHRMLAASPDAHVILQIPALDVDEAFHAFHDEITRLREHGGTTHERADFNALAFVSAIDEAMTALVQHVERQSYASSVAGYQVDLFGAGEETGLPAGYWFYSDAALTQFQTWLHDRYATIEALRSAWNEPGLAAFEAVTMPDPTAFTQSTWGAFRHPVNDAKSSDVSRFWQEAWVAYLGRVAETIKTASTGNPLVGISYGYGLEAGQAFHSGQQALRRILEHPDIDFLCAPYSDLYRVSGASYDPDADHGAGVFRGAIDSILAAGKLWFTEDDSPTWLAVQPVDHSRFPTAELGRNHLRRNQVVQLTRGAGLWRSDASGSGWYNDVELMEELGRQRMLHELLLQDTNAQARFCQPDVAIIIDEDSPAYIAPDGMSGEMPVRVDTRLVDHLHRAGHQPGVFLLDDLMAGLVPDCPVYLFAGVHRLSAEHRAWIDAHLKKDGKVLIWLYGAGLYGHDGWGLNEMSAVTGMTFAEQGTAPPMLVAAPDMDLVVSMPGANATGIEGQPRWYVSDAPAGATVLAHYDVLGEEPALVVAPMSGWLSVYAGTTHLEPRWLQAILRTAGAPARWEADVISPVHTGRGVIGIWPTTAVTGTVHLAAPSNVYDLYSGELVAMHANQFAVDAEAWALAAYKVQPAGASWRDGMFWGWQQRHFTFSEIRAGMADADRDADENGESNYLEFIADTDPRTPFSVFELNAASGLNAALAFQSSAQRWYSVHATTSLVHGVWWTVGAPMWGTGEQMLIPLTNVLSPTYYRVQVTLP